MKKKAKRRLLIFGSLSIVVIIYFFYTVITSSYTILKLQKEKKMYEDKLAYLIEKERELKENINKLQDPEYIARYARENYLYSKDGEYILKIDELVQEKEVIQEKEGDLKLILTTTVFGTLIIGGYIIYKIKKKS